MPIAMTSVVQYAALSFYDGSKDTEKAVAVLALMPVAHESERLVVRIRHNWEREFEESECLQLARDILEDLSGVSPLEAKAVFDDFIDASNGPLRAIFNRSCSVADFDALITQHLDSPRW